MCLIQYIHCQPQVLSMQQTKLLFVKAAEWCRAVFELVMADTQIPFLISN